MSAAEVTGAEAIHPGYGFLSENAKFAEIVTKHGLKFIGPSSDLIKKMGDKIQARKIAKENGLPIIEGSEGDINSVEEAKKISKKIGYPVLIKAAGGGGGKGMKVANKPEELEKITFLWLDLRQKNILIMIVFILKNILKILDI